MKLTGLDLVTLRIAVGLGIGHLRRRSAPARRPRRSRGGHCPASFVGGAWPCSSLISGRQLIAEPLARLM